MSKFIRNTNYNGDTKNQMWMSMISDGHDIFCGCPQPFAHLLDSIFPEGHRDRNKTIQRIIDRDYKECLSGGQEERNLGMADGAEGETPIKEEEDQGIDEDLDALLAAAASAAEGTR